jgi:hypothetical protein
VKHLRFCVVSSFSARVCVVDSWLYIFVNKRARERSTTIVGERYIGPNKKTFVVNAMLHAVIRAYGKIADKRREPASHGGADADDAQDNADADDEHLSNNDDDDNDNASAGLCHVVAEDVVALIEKKVGNIVNKSVILTVAARALELVKADEVTLASNVEEFRAASWSMEIRRAIKVGSSHVCMLPQLVSTSSAGGVDKITQVMISGLSQNELQLTSQLIAAELARRAAGEYC